MKKNKTLIGLTKELYHNKIPAIIISNRMFAGFEVDGINVINPFEFSNSIEKGEIVKLGKIIKTHHIQKRL